MRGSASGSVAARRLSERFLAAARENAMVFRGAASEAQSVTSHEWILAGPAETGKTYAACWRLDSEMRANPGAKAVIVRQVRADMRSTVLGTWSRVVSIRGGVETAGGENPDLYRYANGSRVYVVGMDRPGAVLSGEFDAVYINQTEELSLEAWEYLSTRCTGRGAVTRTPMLFGDCNPAGPAHWILRRPSLRVLHSRHEDNPTLHTGATWTEQGTRTLAVLDSLTGVRRERLRYGRWVAAEGTVYDGFQRGVHVIERFPIPASWQRIRAVDFGYSNPFVCLWIAIDGDGRMYLYREIYRTRRIVEDHCRDIVRLSAGELVAATVSDHDSEDRATMERHGISTIAASKALAPGIQVMQSRLRIAGDGRPRLFVLEGSLVERDEDLAAAHRPVCTLDEFEVYAWPKGEDGRTLKEAPVKLHDHAMDALRYACMYLETGQVSLAAERVSYHSLDVGRGSDWV